MLSVCLPIAAFELANETGLNVQLLNAELALYPAEQEGVSVRFVFDAEIAFSYNYFSIFLCMYSNAEYT